MNHRESLRPSAKLFTQLSKILKLNKVQEVMFGLSLVTTGNVDLQTFVAQFIKRNLPALLQSYVDNAELGGNQEGDFQELPIDILHLFLSLLLSGKEGASSVEKEQIDNFLEELCKDIPLERCPVMLAPLLYPKKQDLYIEKILPDSRESAKDIMVEEEIASLTEIMQEIGYSFCASLGECRNIILQYGVRVVTASQVARVLGMMARSHSGLADGIPIQSISAQGGIICSDGKDNNDGTLPHTWNVEVLIDAFREVNPNLNFKEVTYELDHSGFIIKDSEGLKIVVCGIQRGLGTEAFPVDLIYRPWKHAEGQLLFIQHSLMSPGVFCFADYPCHTVAIDILKTPLEADNREIASWKSLDLIESLLRLSEVGQYEQVKQLFSFPVKHCPDILMLALLQIATSWHTLRHELLSALVPIFLDNHPNSSSILRYAWYGQGQSQAIRQLIMHSMAEWYMRDQQYDQAKLSHILDVAQDLKSLSTLLNGTNFPFVIDLAVLSSHREHLHLDKWLPDKIKEHGNPFFQACVMFLLRRCPSKLGVKDKDLSKITQLPPETLATILANVCNVLTAPTSSIESWNQVGIGTSDTRSVQCSPSTMNSAFGNPPFPAKALPSLSTPSRMHGNISSLSTYPPGPLGSAIGSGREALGVSIEPSDTRRNIPDLDPDTFQQTDLSVQQATPSTPVTTSTTTTTATKISITTRCRKDLPPSITDTTTGADQTERIVEPPDYFRDKIAFIFNNLTQSNMTQKAVELKAIEKEEFMPWVSQYMLGRLRKEPIFHSAYSNFLDMLNNPKFLETVLAETYRSVKDLLTSDHDVAVERPMLKNLGNWLGMITLVKDKPILCPGLEIKSLLLEAYEKGQQELLNVLCFVAKVLESTLHNKSFSIQQNEWSMGIMNILKELHQQNLELKLKFEIELLWGNLGLDTNDLKRGNRIEEQEEVQSPTKETHSVVTTASPSSPTESDTTTCGTTEISTSQLSCPDTNVCALAGPALHINIHFPLLQSHPQLKQCVHQAVELAVQELVPDVVKNSIKAALASCEQIDLDESCRRDALHQYMNNMISSMANNALREKLNTSIATNLKNGFAALLGAPPTPQQTEIIEEAVTTITQDNRELTCGYLEKTARDKAGPELYKTIYDMDQVFKKCIADLEQHLHAIPPVLAMSPQTKALHTLLETVSLARNSRDEPDALDLLQKAAKGLLNATNMSNADLLQRYRDCHLLVLKTLRDERAYGPRWCDKHITRCLIECHDEYRYNTEAVELLIRNNLVNLQQYDLRLAELVENGHSAGAFALVNRLVVNEQDPHEKAKNERDLSHTITALMTLIGNAPEGQMQLMDVLPRHEAMSNQTHNGPNFRMNSGISQASDYADPPGLENAKYLLREWVDHYYSRVDSTRGFPLFVQKMHNQGILKTDELMSRFFRRCTEICVENSYRDQAEKQHNSNASAATIRAKCYHELDAYVRLITLLVKQSINTLDCRVNLLIKVLDIIQGVLIQDHGIHQAEFLQLPFHRIFMMLMLELNSPEHILETNEVHILDAFFKTFQNLRPTEVPGFVYAWLELISHRVFISRILAHTPLQNGWPRYASLLINLFEYQAPFLRNVELSQPMQMLYRGTLRLLLLLMHDFPEFLCKYHYVFCDIIPPNCIQLRNIILSACPRNMTPPNPFTPNLKVDMLSDINVPPQIYIPGISGVMPSQFRNNLDSYLMTRLPATFLSELQGNLQHPHNPGNRYNIQLINALVLYVGMQAIDQISKKGRAISLNSITHSTHMDIFHYLAVELDTEGRYLFLNAVATQLRYPNSHTHYFSCTMLSLFAKANTEDIQEQIIRVLLERLIVNRPQPWGLLITLIELLKNPAFKLMSHDFVHCAPEITKMFQSVEECCKDQAQVMEGAGAS